MRYRIATVLLTLLAGTICTAAYWPGLFGGFFFDDGPSILIAEGVKLRALTFESIHQAWASGNAGPLGRPVAQLSFALNYHFSGFNPFAFKITNLAIHLSCGFLLFLISNNILPTGGTSHRRNSTPIIAGTITFLWLIHPIQLLPILHVVQRMTSLSALFLLAAFLLHVLGRKDSHATKWGLIAIGWAVFWPLSLLSKETGMIFPLLVLAWELILRRRDFRTLDSFARIYAALICFGVAATAVFVLSPEAQWLWSGYRSRPFTLFERALTEGRVIWEYIGLIFAPRLEAFGLYHDDILISSSLFSPWTTIPAAIGLFGAVWAVWRWRVQMPIVAFGIAWFLLGHVIESTILPLEIAHEHRNYVPLFGILIACTQVLAGTCEKNGSRKTIAIALTAGTIAFSLFVTTIRAHQFGDELRRTQIEAQHHRASTRAQYEAGRTLSSLAEAESSNSLVYSLARAHFERSIELDATFKLGLLGLIKMECVATGYAQEKSVSELRKRLATTPFTPTDSGMMFSLKEMSISGSICLNRSDVDSLFAASFANDNITRGMRATLYSWHADYSWLHEHDVAAAKKALAQSLELNPANDSNQLKWAQLLLVSGETERARKLLFELNEMKFSAEEKNTLNELRSSHPLNAN